MDPSSRFICVSAILGVDSLVADMHRSPIRVHIVGPYLGLHGLLPRFYVLLEDSSLLLTMETDYSLC